MIKNIVFDLGGVLVNFKPENYLRHLGFSDNDVDLFTKIVFWNSEWNDYNCAKCDEKQLVKNLTKNYPEHKDKIKIIFDNIDYKYILFEKTDTSEYLKELKNKGFNIYILSDLSVDSYNYNKNFDFFNYVDGGIFSFKIGSTKPNDNNYKTLLSKYNLVPEETIFIDDKLEYTDAAKKFGINPVQFTTLNEVKEKINKLITK